MRRVLRSQRLTPRHGTHAVTRASSAPQVTRRGLIAVVPALVALPAFAAGSSNTQRLTGGGYKVRVVRMVGACARAELD